MVSSIDGWVPMSSAANRGPGQYRPGPKPKPRRRGAGRPGRVAPAGHRAPYYGPEMDLSLKHPAGFSVAAVRIVGPIVPDSGPDPFERRLSFWNSPYRLPGVTVE